MSFRCIVWAAVSSAPQAQDDKVSIPSQIANAQALITRRGWVEVAPPLIVPGLSRSIDWLHEAVEEIPAMADLVEIAKHDTVDLVICRDYDRLARTRTLLTQISTYLNRCMVQIYAMDKPVEPIPVDELRRQRGLYSSATVEAFAGLAAEQEVARIVQRRYYGMNNAARRGLWRHPAVTYGYTREVKRDGYTIYLDVPEINPAEAAVVTRIERMYLDGDGCRIIARQLNLENVPHPGNSQSNGKGWYQAVVNRILTNPWYSGYLTWGIRRRRRVYDPERETFVSKDLYAPAYQELKEALGHRPTVSELLAHQEELAAGDVIVTRGQHEAIRTLERQQVIDDEMDFRRSHRRAASTAKRCYLFSGLIRCAECGRTFMARTTHVTDKRYNRRYKYVYYTCPALQHGQDNLCGNRAHIRESVVLEQLQSIIQALSDDPMLIEKYLQQASEQNIAEIKAETAGAREAKAGLASRRQRWDSAYEAGVLSLEEYGQRIGELAQEQVELDNRIAVLEQQLSHIVRQDDRRTAILKAVENPPDLKNRKKAKVYFRRIFEEIVVQDGEIKSVTLRA